MNIKELKQKKCYEKNTSKFYYVWKAVFGKLLWNQNFDIFCSHYFITEVLYLSNIH